MNHQVATIGDGQVLDLVEVTECERGRYQAGDDVPLWRGGELMLESWWFKPRDLHFVEAGLRRCSPASVVEVWCDVPAHVAKGRYAVRQRHRIHHDRRQLVVAWPWWKVEAEPLGVTPVVRVNTHGPVDLVDVADRIAKARM